MEERDGEASQRSWILANCGITIVLYSSIPDSDQITLVLQFSILGAEMLSVGLTVMGIAGSFQVETIKSW